MLYVLLPTVTVVQTDTHVHTHTHRHVHAHSEAYAHTQFSEYVTERNEMWGKCYLWFLATWTTLLDHFHTGKSQHGRVDLNKHTNNPDGPTSPEHFCMA